MEPIKNLSMHYSEHEVSKKRQTTVYNEIFLTSGCITHDGFHCIFIL